VAWIFVFQAVHRVVRRVVRRVADLRAFVVGLHPGYADMLLAYR